MLKKLFLILIIISLPVIFFLFSKKEISAQATTINYWNASATFPGTSHPMPSFIAGDYYYVLLTNRNIVYAKIKAGGGLDPWQTATAQHAEAGGRGFTAVVVNNIPYSLRFGRSEKFNIDSTGNITEITQVGPDDRIGGYYYYWNSATTAVFDATNYVFNFGGFDCCDGAHYSNNNRIFKSTASTNPWQWTEVNISRPYQNPYKSVFYRVTGQNYGYFYLSDFGEDKNPNPLYRVKVTSEGNLEGSFVQTDNLPNKDTSDPHSLGEIFTINNTLFIIRGKKVYSATINSTDGSLSAWSDLPADLPVTQINKGWEPSAGSDHTDGTSMGIKNGYVYVTGPDRVYYTQVGGTAPSTSPNPTNPNPTATTAPAPTIAPCPDTLAKDSKIIFTFSADRIVDDANFNTAGGLTIVAKNATQKCKLTVNNVPIVGATQGYTTKEYVNLPNGEYSLFISGPRNIRQQFNTIKLATGQELICTGASQPADCGEIGNAALRNERKLLSGDANSDGIIDIIDFELYRQNVGHSATGNNTDFDYNGNVEYKNGVNDDFEFLKANFGKGSNDTYSPILGQTPTPTSTVPTATPAVPTQGQGSGTITGIFTIRANGKTYNAALVPIWDWPPAGEIQASLHGHATLNPTVPSGGTSSDMTIIYTISGLTDGQKYIVSPSVVIPGAQNSATFNPQDYCPDTNGSIPDPVLRANGCPVTVPGIFNFTISL